MAGRISARATTPCGSLFASFASDHPPGRHRFSHCGWQRRGLTTQVYVARGGPAHLQPDRDLAFPVLRVPYDGFDRGWSAIRQKGEAITTPYVRPFFDSSRLRPSIRRPETGVHSRSSLLRCSPGSSWNQTPSIPAPSGLKRTSAVTLPAVK